MQAAQPAGSSNPADVPPVPSGGSTLNPHPYRTVLERYTTRRTTHLSRFLAFIESAMARSLVRGLENVVQELRNDMFVQAEVSDRLDLGLLAILGH